MNLNLRSQKVKHLALHHGFLDCRIAKAEFMEPEAKKLEQWLTKDYHGSMTYMENHFDLRVDPTLLVPGAKSMILLLANYYPKKSRNNHDLKVAKYAYGEDYHIVLKDKLFALLHDIKTEFGNVQGRCFVDSAPVLERDWAKRAGLGWIGKNTLLLTKKRGSFFFIAELILDLELDVDNPVADHCGTCRKCIDSCPTDAIHEDGYVLDSRKCISYLTIENKSEIPNEFSGTFENWIFGCDICQDVCPWNKFSQPTEEERFSPLPFVDYTEIEWQELTQENFDELAKKSPLSRTGFQGMRRNINFVS